MCLKSSVARCASMPRFLSTNSWNEASSIRPSSLPPSSSNALSRERNKARKSSLNSAISALWPLKKRVNSPLQMYSSWLSSMSSKSSAFSLALVYPMLDRKAWSSCLSMRASSLPPSLSNALSQHLKQSLSDSWKSNMTATANRFCDGFSDLRRVTNLESDSSDLVLRRRPMRFSAGSSPVAYLVMVPRRLFMRVLFLDSTLRIEPTGGVPGSLSCLAMLF
mmetsp:Transcript_32417/g.75315  ORF Transcript_32417/g.75315 Transcript_32417/m.75315 type:complete len:221 (-) Transcript_32417:97-759(-)